MIMWIPQQISCRIHMITVRAAVPAGRYGRNGHVRAGVKAGSAQLHGIARYASFIYFAYTEKYLVAP